MHLVFKYSHSFSQSQHGLKVQVSSKTQGNLLIVAPIKIKEYITCFQHTMAQILHQRSEREEWDTERNYWTGAGPEPRRANSKFSVLKGPRDPNACATNKLAFSVVVLAFGNSEGLSLD